MSISSRITAMQEHLQDDYDVLDLAGADLTNVDKNIVNLKPTWKERLLYFINNGTDEVYDNWDKVTGEGEGISLNNTLEAKMKIILKGNTSQNGTPTPESPQDIHVVSGDNSIEVKGKNLFNLESTNRVYVTPNTISITGTSEDFTISSNVAYDTVAFYIGKINYDTIYKYLSSNYVAGSMWLCATNSSSYSSWSAYSNDRTIISSDWAQSSHSLSNYQGKHLWLQLRGSTDASGYNSVNYKNFILSSTQVNSYEEYKSASYPISLGVENLFDKNNFTELNAKIDSGSIVAASAERLMVFQCQPNTTYTFTKLVNTPYQRNYIGETTTSPTTGTSVSNTSSHLDTNSFSYTTSANAQYIVWWYYCTGSTAYTKQETLDSIVIEKGSKANHPSATPIELCKIGTYQDKIDKSSGKNLFNYNDFNTKITTATITGVANNFKIERISTSTINYYLDLPSGVAYTFSGNWSTTYGNGAISIYYDDDTRAGFLATNYSSSSANGTISLTTDATKKISYLKLELYNNCNFTIENFVVNEGSTALPYEPYGTDWYLKKEIGKVVLNGTEAGWNRTGTSTSGNYYFFINSFLSNVLYSSNRFIGLSNIGVTTNAYNGVEGADTILYNSVSVTRVYTDTTKNMSIDDFKTWISSNNVTLYYVLATPTYSTITDTTLISQLEKLNNAKSYNQQTNISQSNNDNASIMNASALQNM